MAGNEFSLPDDLGWDCNDELQKVLDEWIDKTLKALKDKRITDDNTRAMILDISKAELIDDMYATIKKYQKK